MTRVTLPLSEVERVTLALRIAAQIVARDGPAYLPVFLRLEVEAEAAEGRNSALARALALTGSSRAA